MTTYTPKLARILFGHICEGYNLKAACKRVGIERQTHYWWMRESTMAFEAFERGEITESKYRLDKINPENPGEVFWYHKLLGDVAKFMSVLNADADARASLEPKQVRGADGKVLFEIDEKIAADAL